MHGSCWLVDVYVALEREAVLRAAFLPIQDSAVLASLHQEIDEGIHELTEARSFFLRVFMSDGRFEAINVAMGNTRIAPYSFCVDAHAGLNADLVSWEMVRLSLSQRHAYFPRVLYFNQIFKLHLETKIRNRALEFQIVKRRHEPELGILQEIAHVVPCGRVSGDP